MISYSYLSIYSIFLVDQKLNSVLAELKGMEPAGGRAMMSIALEIDVGGQHFPINSFSGSEELNNSCFVQLCIYMLIMSSFET